MKTMTRVLSKLAYLANAHPLAVLALTLMAVATFAGLVIFGAVSLFTEPALPKLFLFEAIVVAAMVALPRAAH